MIRGSNHKRSRPENSKFVVGPTNNSFVWRNITVASGKDRKDAIAEFNWLGRTWMKEFNGYKMPSLNQIENGLVTEAINQLREAVGQMKDQKSIL